MLGHAIGAAEITAVRDRYPKIRNRAGERIDQGRVFHSFNLGGWRAMHKLPPITQVPVDAVMGGL